MLPSTGWLTVGTTGSPEVLDLELPTPYTGNYKEGVGLPNEPIIQASNLTFDQVAFIAVLAQCSIALGHNLFNARALEVSLTRQGVYGFLLLDSFTPPLITQEFFEFNAYTQLSCVGSSFTGTPPAYSGCAEGDDTEYVEDGVTTPTFEDA